MPGLMSAAKKSVLSMINDFEDGKWRRPEFEKFVWDNIAQTALSASERNSLVSKSYSELVAAAKNLRLSDLDVAGEGSEIAEIFLYGVMKHHFNALPVVPKIFYKQNTQDYAKGADSVHIVLKDEDFTLWFGEAKFYSSIENARLPNIIQSVFQSLRVDKLKKENSIITNIPDIDLLDIPEHLKHRIKDSLKQRNSIDNIKDRIHVPIMLIHECDITRKETELSETYKKSIIEHHIERSEAYFSRQISKSSEIHKYDKISFHLILFPVPEKSPIVQRFTNIASAYRS